MSEQPRRRKRSTIQEQYVAMQAATEEVIPPVPLKPDVKTMFDMIIASREKLTWRPNDIFLAVKLAKTYIRIEEVENILDDEGILVNVEGGRLIHDLIGFKMKLEHAAIKLNRVLGLGVDPRGVTSAANSMMYSWLQKQTQQAQQDDLLAAPQQKN